MTVTPHNLSSQFWGKRVVALLLFHVEKLLCLIPNLAPLVTQDKGSGLFAVLGLIRALCLRIRGLL